MSMKRTSRLPFLLIICVLANVSRTVAAEQEGITVDPNTGDYVVTYKSGYSGKLNTVIFVPATKINPRLQSKYRQADGKNLISYEYKLKNEAGSRQNIDMLYTRLSSILPNSPKAPAKWDVNVAQEFGDQGVNISWTYRGETRLGGLSPSSTQDGFAVESGDLPGVVVVRVSGARPVIEWVGHFPAGAVGEEMDRILEKDFVPRLAATPRIPNPTPFNAVIVLTGIEQHLRNDLVPMKLVEPVFAERFGRLLGAAIEAARGGNTAGLQSHLKDLRKMLKGFGEPSETNHKANREEIPEDEINSKHWPHPVAKLAARVLDFDLEYVEKQVKGGKG